MKKPIIKYPPGSDWLYFKIYGGPQALEEWLVGPFFELLSQWKAMGLVSQYHYVHYIDPEYHLRLRFLLSDPVHSGILLTQIKGSCSQMLEEDLMWKIEIATYEPEYERYGVQRMDLVEFWFNIDSWFWLEEIKRITRDDNPEIWKRALKSVDVLLNDFDASMEDKLKIVNRSKESAANIFGVNKTMRSQLDEKYRKMHAEIIGVLDDTRIDNFFASRSNEALRAVLQLQATFSSRNDLFESNLLPDLLHMSLNRAFRTRHRLQELVIYDFLSRYYESAKARAKKGIRDEEQSSP